MVAPLESHRCVRAAQGSREGACGSIIAAASMCNTPARDRARLVLGGQAVSSGDRGRARGHHTAVRGTQHRAAPQGLRAHVRLQAGCAAQAPFERLCSAPHKGH